MAEWIAIGLTAASLLIAIGTYIQWKNDMDKRVEALESSAQTPTEREALAKILETKFHAHEEKDDLRFDGLSRAIEMKLDLILTAVNGKSNTNHG